MPDPEKDGESVVVVCEDTVGIEDLTPGVEYSGVTGKDGLYEIENDRGERRGFFKDRFRRIRQLVNV
jgi:hypothetical protein